VSAERLADPFASEAQVVPAGPIDELPREARALTKMKALRASKIVTPGQKSLVCQAVKTVSSLCGSYNRADR